MSQLQLQPVTAIKQPDCPDSPCSGLSMVLINLPHAGLYALRQQIDRDFKAKALGHSPLPFTVLQLLDLEKLLMLHRNRETIDSRDNLVLSSAQQGLLARYIHRYYLLAQTSGDGMRESVYLDCLYALSINSTQIFELLVPTRYDFSVTTRPLALLWDWACGLIIWYRQRQFTPIRQATK